MRQIQITTVLFTILAATACERVDSSQVRTGGIYAGLEVTARGDGKSTVSAGLRVGGSLSNTYLELVDGDQLMAISGDENRTMSKRSAPLGPVRYRADFDVDEEDTPFRISFERESHDETEKKCRGGSAPNSFATLPAPFEIDDPAKERFSRKDDDVEITWSVNGTRDPMAWSLRGDCIQSLSGTDEDDSGRLVIERGDVELLRNAETDRCTVTLELSREREGEVDPAYGEGGRFVARQVREVRFESAP